MKSGTVSRTVSPLYCSKYLRPGEGHDGGRLIWWLFVPGLVASLGLAAPTLALWGGEDLPRWLERTVSWPALNLSLQVQQALAFVGAVGVIVLAASVLFWVAPVFHRLFERSSRLTGRSFLELDAPRLRAEVPAGSPVPEEVRACRQRFLDAMDDDFNTGGAIGELYDLVRALNRLADSEHRDGTGPGSPPPGNPRRTTPDARRRNSSST